MITEIIHQFKNYLQNVGYSDTVIKMLPVLVKEFMTFVFVSPCGGDLEGADISFIEQEKVKLFLDYLQTRPLKKRSGALSESMISQYVYGLKTFFSWCEVTEQIDYNPISGMKFKRPKQNIREPLSLEEITQLFTAVINLKQQTILHLFYSCGLRRSEGEALNINDIHFKQQLLYVRAGKGTKRRVIPITAKVTKELEEYYLQERCNSINQKVKDTEAFILNQIGNRMRGDGYNKILQQIITNCQLPIANCSLHHLRHSIATHLLQSGMSMEYVRDFLGHSFLETTQIYAKPKAEQLKLL